MSWYSSVIGVGAPELVREDRRLGVPYRGTVPYDGTATSESSPREARCPESSPSSAPSPSSARSPTARSVSPRSPTGRAPQVDRRAPARLTRPRGRRRAGPGGHALPARAALGDARGRADAGAVAGGRGTTGLRELAESAGEAAGLSVPDGDLVHYIDQVDSPNPVSVRDWTGTRVPLHAVSSGQVLLAFRPPAADRALPRASARAVHAAHAGRSRGAARAAARHPPRRVLVGARGVRRGHLVGRGACRRRIRRGHRGGPPARAVVPVPGRRDRGRHGGASHRDGRPHRRRPASHVTI